MTTRTAAVLALALSLAPRALAQGPSAAAPQPKPPASGATAVPPAAKDLARTLTTEPTWNEMLDAYASSLSRQLQGALSATGKDAPKDLEPKVRSELADAVTYPQAIDIQARALAAQLSPDEMRAITKFYASAPGKKLLAALPDVSRKVNDDLRTRLSERVPKIVEKYAPSLAAAQPGGSAGAAGSPSPSPGAKPGKGGSATGGTGSSGGDASGAPRGAGRP